MRAQVSIELVFGWKIERLTGPQAVLEPEVAVPLDNREREHVPVTANQLQCRQRSERGSVRQQACPDSSEASQLSTKASTV